MKNSTYKSVPVIASVIGSISRKSMYLVNITSLDGTKIYNNAWVPTSWQSSTGYEWRYNKALVNPKKDKKYKKDQGVQLYEGRYYKLHFDESLLLTNKGFVNYHGAKIECKGLQKVKQGVTKQQIAWEHYGQQLVEFPLKQATGAMAIDRNNVTIIKSRLVDGKVEEFLQLSERFIIHIPTWMISNLKLKFQSAYSVDDELFSNEDDTNTESIIEETAINSEIAEKFNYIDRHEMDFQVIDSLTQWELDNPEYV